MMKEKLMGGEVLASPNVKPENQNYSPHGVATDIGLCNFQNQKNQNFSPYGVATSSGLRNAQHQIDSVTDAHLYNLCRVYGARTLKWRQKFMGLLPEVFRRGLYVKKGFGSIFEFAKKLAGLSEEQVRLTLNLEKRFENLPELRLLLINGEVSVNKLARVVSIATSENERFLATNLIVLSQAAVETLVRDEKWKNSEIEMLGSGDGLFEEEGNCKKSASATGNQNGLFEPEFGDKSLRAQIKVQPFSAESNGGKVGGDEFAESSGENGRIDESAESSGENDRLDGPSGVDGRRDEFRGGLNLSSEVHAKLLELQQKGIDINQLLAEFLENREQEIAQKKEQIRSQVLEKEQKKSEAGEAVGRYRPTAVDQILQEEFGTKCAVKNCRKPATENHHALPFAIGKTHDPYIMIPLCKAHHELAHAVNRQYVKMRAGKT